MDPPNIYIIGAQCTGKTTLVSALKDHFTRYREKNIPEPVIISEVARKVLAALNINRSDIVTSPEKSLQLQTAILEAQVKAETAAETAGSWFISDRSGLDPIVYTRVSVSENATQELLQSAGWKLLEQKMKKAQVFVCEAGCSWLVDDGTRWMPSDAEHWDHLDQAFRTLLRERGIHYQIVPRDVIGIDDRVRIVVGRD